MDDERASRIAAAAIAAFTEGQKKMKGNLQKRGLNSWRLKYDLEPDGLGRRQTRYATLKGTRKEAEAQASRILAAVADGLDVDPSTLTVASHLRAWLGGSHGLAAEDPMNVMSKLIEQQIIPAAFGAPGLCRSFRPAHIAEAWHAALLEVGRAGGRPAISSHRRPRPSCPAPPLSRADTAERVARNVASAVTPPKVEDTEIVGLKADEVAAVLMLERSPA